LEKNEFFPSRLTLFFGLLSFFLPFLKGRKEERKKGRKEERKKGRKKERA